jgi:glycosyltransferase involved in cell wall biosynthesis
VRICFIADARSPIAAAWIRFFVERGHDTYVISRLQQLPGSANLLRVSVPAMAGRPPKGNGQQPANGESVVYRSGLVKALKSELRGGRLSHLATVGAGVVAIATTYVQARRVRRLIDEIEPELVHALRIPFEGILAATSAHRVPLLLSVWGNDFTLHARRNPVVASLTRIALNRADALHTDCSRDLRLAIGLGFDRGRPSVVLPGGGGVTDMFLQVGTMRPEPVATESPIVLNPRGLRAYVRNDSFFQAIPLVRQVFPGARFLCTGMQDEPVAKRWVERLRIQASVDLLPVLDATDLANCFARADISVSPSIHDGTPNTLLEAMAAGAFPVVGSIESVQEWIRDGYNGLLCDPASPESIAAAIIRAVQDPALRACARKINASVIARRARYGDVMREAQDFYYRVTGRVMPPSTPASLACRENQI